MKRFAFAVAMTIVAAAPAAAEPPPEAPPAPRLTVSQFILLRPVAGMPSMGERARVRMQQDHLDWLRNLYGEGKVMLSGPIAGAADLAGVLVLRVPTAAEARAVVAGDPRVRAGHLAPEVIPWWSESDGIVRAPSHLLHTDRVWLGLFVRPADAPGYPDETLREIQRGHLANLSKMAESGDLVLAGPFENDGPLRGVLVFRTQDPSRIRELVARDPAVKAGRLGVELYPWSIPRGSLPEPAP